MILGLASVLLVGCGDSSAQPSPGKTDQPSSRTAAEAQVRIAQPYQNRLQYVVHEIASSLAAWSWYAVKGAPPGPGDIQIRLNDLDAAPGAVPRIRLELLVGGASQTAEWNTRRPWLPGEYLPIESSIAAKLALRLPVPDPPALSSDRAGAWLDQFLDGENATIESENQRLSVALQSSILDADSHEKAAVLLGLMALRENADVWQETQVELSRATAHLAFARAIRGDTNGPAKTSLARMAELLLLTGANLQTEALRALDELPAESGIPAHWVTLLRVENCGDYRLLQPAASLRPTERHTWARAKAHMNGGSVANEILHDPQRAGDVHLLRILRSHGHSIEVGHVLAENEERAELDDFRKVYGVSHRLKLDRSRLIPALNRVPSQAFDEEGRLRVISEGHWAMQYQRHLGSALLNEVYFIRTRLSVPQEATNSIRALRARYDGMSLMPFLVHFRNLQTSPAQEPLSSAALPMLLEHPELVPGVSWLRLAMEVKGPEGLPTWTVAREWEKHTPLPGTALERGSRPPVYGTPPSLPPAQLVDFHRLAPHEPGLTELYVRSILGSNPPPAEIREAWGPILEYSRQAISSVAYAFKGDPDEYERQMLKATELDSDTYLTLGKYFLELVPSQRERGIGHLRKGYSLSEDRVGASYYALPLVDYYLDAGRDAEARAIATDAASTYSNPGLWTLGHYYEVRKQFAEAREWFQRADDRYASSQAVLEFGLRVLPDVRDATLAQELRSIIASKRPTTLTPVILAELKGPPVHGVQFAGDNPLMRESGLKRGDVVVAAYGYQVRNMIEYGILRESTPQTNLVITVWDGIRYRELSVNIPHKRFGVSVQDYPLR